jgi:glycosyltransferase involved in cell wall biosynthesis
MVERVSIIIPTRDRHRLLTRALASALKAARATDEIIVVDDASQIGVGSVVQSFNDSRIQLVQALGKGAGHARNCGIAAATGTLLFFLDDDDELACDYIRHIVAIRAAQVPVPRFGYAPIVRCRVEKSGPSQRHKARAPSGYFDYNLPFDQRSHGFGMGFWGERALFAELGPIDETLLTNEDTEFLLRITQADIVGWYAAVVGVFVHQHNGQDGEMAHLTGRTSARSRSDAMNQIASQYAGLIAQDKSMRSYFDLRRMRLSIKDGGVADAFAVLRRNLRLKSALCFAVYVVAYSFPRRARK